MNCERNICYQQDYNGGCDTCPCNDELQECKEENGQSMTNQEIVEQLKSLKCHCEDFREDDECIWAKDVEALDKAIEALEKQKHNCEDCKNADYVPSINAIYCLEYCCVMKTNNYCRDWSDADAD